MKPGAVIDGLLVEAVGSTRDGVGRAVVRGPDGARGELLWVVAPDPALRDRFLEGHRALAAFDAPGILGVRSIVDRPDLAAVHRAPTLDAPLERLPAPLPGSVVAGIGASLAPTLPAATAVLGELRVEDLAADLGGAPVLAPRLGRPKRPGGRPGDDLARLLIRWWTGRSPPSGPLLPPPDLDPRAAEGLDALAAGEPARAAAVFGAIAGATPDLRPHLSVHPAAIEVQVTRTAPDPAAVGRSTTPWRAAGWVAAAVVWIASAIAALTVVLIPLAAIGAAAGAALAAAGEWLARRPALPGPAPRRALADRTRGGKLAAGWGAVDAARQRLADARLPPPVDADVRQVIARWEGSLTALATATPVDLASRGDEVQRGIAEEARRMLALLERLDADDESALSDLARWVHDRAP